MYQWVNEEMNIIIDNGYMNYIDACISIQMDFKILTIIRKSQKD